MLRLTCLALVAMLPLQGGEDEPTIAEELDALIAKTNALGSFHAVYRLELTEEGKTHTGSLELAYDAPDRGLFRSVVPPGSIEVWCAETSMTMHVLDEDGKETWKLVDLPAPEARRVLDMHFPPDRGSIGPGVSFILRWPGMEGYDGDVQLRAMTSPEERGQVLRWLGYLREHGSQVRREERRLLWSSDVVTCSFSRDSGFMERFEGKGDDGMAFTLTLDELQVDEPVGSLLELPSAASGAEVADGWKLGNALGDLRKSAFERVGSRLSSGELEWKHDVQEDWRSVLDAIHREWIPWCHRTWMENLRKATAGIAEQIRTIMAEDPPADAIAHLHDQVEEARRELVDKVATAEQHYRAGMPEIPAAPQDHEPPRELLEVEDEVVRSVFAELVADPLLDDFDDQLEEAFDS